MKLYLKFKRGQSFIKLSNSTAKVLNLKSNTALHSVSFDLVQNISDSSNVITHFLTDLDSSLAFSMNDVRDGPIQHPKMTNGRKTVQHDSYHHSIHNRGIQSHSI